MIQDLKIRATFKHVMVRNVNTKKKILLDIYFFKCVLTFDKDENKRKKEGK